MRLSSLRVTGYQSFTDSGELVFGHGINLVVGQNNAGKSAILRSLLPTFNDDRHRTPEKWELFRLPIPRTHFKIEISGQELRESFLRSGGMQFLPVSAEHYQDVTPYIQSLFQQPSLSVVVTRQPQNAFTASYPALGNFIFQPGSQQYCAGVASQDGELSFSPQVRGEDNVPNLLWNLWQTQMFYFSPERFALGRSGHGYATRLNANADNLPIVLHTLEGNSGAVFQRLVRHLRDIFSTVGNLSVGPSAEGGLEVRVWPTEEMERVELSFPLNSSGTGVSQVIAILTAVMTVERAVIVVDEINSFLHPAAVKALLRILQTDYSQHQYIVSTHAPEVIGFSNPKTIHLVRRQGYESSVRALDLAGVDEFREVAEHLGVSMADVFAADRVIWVEGPTEELCFPHLYQQMIGPLPRGVLFTSVTATGDFNRNRDREIVYEVYERLSSAAVTMAVTVVFSFDAEELSADRMAKMNRDAQGRLRFLPRRHLECYFLDPSAISRLIHSKVEELNGALTAEAVGVELARLAGTPDFLIPEWSGDIFADAWLTKVDSASLIKAACANLSEHRAPFAKKEDSLALMQDILEHDPQRLAPLRDYVAGLVAAVSPAVAAGA